jgi:hypothetical protein
MALYVASIYIRNRNLQQDMSMLEEMEKPAPPVEVRQPKKSAAKPTGNRSAKPVTKKSPQK